MQDASTEKPKYGWDDAGGKKKTLPTKIVTVLTQTLEQQHKNGSELSVVQMRGSESHERHSKCVQSHLLLEICTKRCSYICMQNMNTRTLP